MSNNATTIPTIPTIPTTTTIPTITSSSLYAHLSSHDQSSPNNTIAIDVRPMSEIRSTFGLTIPDYLPPSALKNPNFVKYIPLEDITSGSWLSDLTPSEFSSNYGFPHPLSSSSPPPIIFICRGGVRSKVACEKAMEQGVKDVTNYVEGAIGWDAWWREKEGEGRK
eukprot:CAMPEP_0118652466 /NCGR_PEP_ID=MMETSP0785-20121206/11334_1 /TAXON_ID=91992 /ORGANISM="Bolidomonas pacifica, Strain CCMP 1866" /LENGTH=165 /DNA_ID=CAMNT_0006544987 /DNA_START=191 /DNA_END=688 /DNA_ORIENTATION=-